MLTRVFVPIPRSIMAPLYPGFDLENVVYYQGHTHYFVMTPTMASLKQNGVIAKTGDASKVVQRDNVDYEVKTNTNTHNATQRNTTQHNTTSQHRSTQHAARSTQHAADSTHLERWGGCIVNILRKAVPAAAQLYADVRSIIPSSLSETPGVCSKCCRVFRIAKGDGVY